MQRKTLIILIYLSFLFSTCMGWAQNLQQRLSTLKDVAGIEQLKSNIFDEKYVIRVQQPLDHQHPSKGSFSQRVIVSHVGYDRPTLIITEGYGASYAFSSQYREELSEMLDANMIFVEHRYFLESMPKPCDWTYLTAENSAYDLHHIRTLFKDIYPGKWISTGISKGGQTTCLYRAYFPDDVDFSVPYVAPLNRGLEDGRHEPFLRKVGTKQERKTIKAFQLEALKRKPALLSSFKSYCDKRKLEFNIPIEEVYDYCVLEYSFSIWQWGTPTSSIPGSDASDKEILSHLVGICGPDYFAKGQTNVSFFVQAARELGYYGYDLKPFRKYLSVKSAKGYVNRIMLPDELIDKTVYSQDLYKKVYNYLKKNDPKMIFIYGEIDPWSATRVPDFRGKKNLQIYIQPRGSHTTRINTMPVEIREKIIKQIKTWMAE